MSHRIACAGRRLTVLAAAVSLFSGPIGAATVDWVGGGGNALWSTPANWSGGVPPGEADDVRLADYATRIAGGRYAVHSFQGSGPLTLSAGRLQAAADSSLGALNWTAGTLAGTGAVVLTGESTWGRPLVRPAGPGTTTVLNTTLDNHGTWLDVSSSWATMLGGRGGVFNNVGTYRKTGLGTSDLSAISYFNAGVTDVQKGLLLLPANVVNAGAVTGNGALKLAGTLTNTALVAPGQALAALTIQGRYAQTPFGTLAIDLQDTSSFDRLVVTGGATLGGTLRLVCAGACAVSVDDSFTVLDARANGLGSSQFSELVTEGFGSGVRFELRYDRSIGDVVAVVTAVPEPPTAWLALAGALVLAAGRRDKCRKPPHPAKVL